MTRSISPELVAALKRLRLGGMLPTLAERLTLAEKEDTPYRGPAAHAPHRRDLAAGQHGLDSSRRARRARSGHGARALGQDREGDLRPRVFDRARLASLRRGSPQRRASSAPSASARPSSRARSDTSAAAQASTCASCAPTHCCDCLKQSRMDNSRDAVMTELTTVDVLIIDDFALEPMTREESRDVYQLFVERNARFSTIVTSNRDTAEWLAIFDDALLAQSAVDRFKNNAYDLVIDGESYRSRLKPNIEKLPPPPSAPVKKVPVHPRTKAAARRR